MATSSPVPLVSQVQRKPQTFTPSPWGDFFLRHIPCTPSKLLAMKERAQRKKEEVRQIILETVASSNLVRKLELVDTLQRIGVDYHYKEEIDDLLRSVYDDKDGGSDNLYITSLRFYLLRKHGYGVSSDVFEKFRDEQGSISKQQDEVQCTLETPRFRRVKRVETRRYISVYEKKATRDATILEFAKLDYNILQAIYCDELKELTAWWKDFQSRIDLCFTRDRMVELHFWMLGVLFEPYHSYPRQMMTKFFIIMTLIDDLYDNYGTTEESDIFTAAMERWDEEITEQLPTYIKALFINIRNTTNMIEEELRHKKNKHAELFKKLVIDMAKNYHAEVKWRDEHFIPTNVEEHLQISLPSSGCMHMTNLGFISLGDVTTKEDVEWALTFPKIIRGVCIVGRVGNDIVSHEREQAKEHVVSTVQTYMNQYEVTVEEANKMLKVIIEEAWMDIVEECIEHKRPMALLEVAVNVARTMDFMYKSEDAFTLSFSLKNTIASIYVNSV
ncbi:unnamed protein product [Miscanthus lutarioriparius]|uniref:Uncharacterized protein n=1 Tax=Miscanthus lutarioriparius TaxID=422564 RepID=A0A811PPX0_9POAL|nr:unnamed protein product [Miscanthus lutarioriparius]